MFFRFIRPVLLAADLLLSTFCLDSTGSLAQASPSPLPATDVLIDAGHGGIDGGTSYAGILEKEINLQMAKKLYAELEGRGIQPILNRSGDYALSDENKWHSTRSRHRKDLSQRKELAEQLHPKVMVSLHVNWSKNNSKSGPLILHQKQDESKKLAVLIQQKLNQVYGAEEKAVLGKKYYILNRTTVPAVIVEMGYISNSSDRAKLTSEKGQKEIIRAIGDGIEEYLHNQGP